MEESSSKNSADIEDVKAEECSKVVEDSAEDKKQSLSTSVEESNEAEVKSDNDGAEENIISSTSKNKDSVDEANLHYEDNICIYTEPESKCQFVWDEGKQEWIARNNPGSLSDQDYDYDGTTYTYTDKDSGVKYKWDVDQNEWVGEDGKADNSGKKGPEKAESEDEEEVENTEQKEPTEITKQDMSKGVYGYENNTHIYTDPADGSKYFWDKEKSAWFPKVDDDFLAQYQMNYGFVDPNENQAKVEDKKPEPPPMSEPESLKRKVPQEPAWFDVGEESTKVYVSGLPSDITETEFIDVMQKCGLVMRDIDNGKMKIKIYLDPETSLPKGDALCTYIKKESVDLALNLLDGYDVRGHRIKVERAKFTMKGGAYDPSLKPKKRRKKDKEKLKKIQEKLFDWRPDKMRGERSKHEQIVIIKNLFDPVDFNKDVKLILEYQQDLREECIKCGAVKKVTIYDRHPEGVAQINFKEVEAADACVQLLNNRWFGKRQITAETWDGKTKYKISETDEQIKARLEKWQKFLETGEEVDEAKGKEDSTLEVSVEANVKRKEENVSVDKDSSSTLKSFQDDDDKSDEKTKPKEVPVDSDGDTRSTVGSDYDTDDEQKNTNK